MTEVETSKLNGLSLSETVPVPVHFSPQAQQRLDELGMAQEFVQMLEQACRMIGGLRGIRVEEYDRMDGSAHASCCLFEAMISFHRVISLAIGSLNGYGTLSHPKCTSISTLRRCRERKMQGRAFLMVAQQLSMSTTEAHWRGAAIHAYYALILECREALEGWGRVVPPRTNLHSFVRLQFVYAADADLNQISDALDRLVRLRN